MKIIEVKPQDSRSRREFLQLPVRLYRKDPNWIRPLDKDIEGIFDPQENPCFQFGECIRWILQDTQGKTIGRIAAFYDERLMNTHNDQPTGGMGFFECIEDQQAAHLLFDTGIAWLKEKGMEAVDAPINFGDRSRWWGLLVDGFSEPNYCVPYHQPYYRDFFESYGFRDYFQQYTYRRRVDGPKLGEEFYAKRERLYRNKAYHIKHIEKKNLDEYAEAFRHIYNESWVKHSGVAELTKEETQSVLKELRQVIDEELIWFAYYRDQPIAFMVLIPELNQLFKYVNGKMNLWGKLKFLYHQKMGHGKKILGLVFGVLPRFQGKGIDSAIIAAFSEIAYSDKFQYTELEFNWVGDFNPPMIHVYESFLATKYKTHITYRLLFDKTKEFKRYSMIK